MTAIRLERSSRTALLWRWVLANAVGELIGLGAVALIAAALVPRARGILPGGAGQLLSASLLIVLGSFEGWVVGTAQAAALQGTGIDPRAWVRATVLGAVLAWTVGMLPSTLMAVLGGARGGAGQGPEPAVKMALAAVLGFVAGPVLATMQVRVLRRHTPRAWWWLLANGLGWALGMPLVFVALGQLARNGPGPATLVRAAGALFAAGAVVGWVEGAFLVRRLSISA